MEAAMAQEEGGGDEALKLPAEESTGNEEAAAKLQKSSGAGSAAAAAEMELDVRSTIAAEESGAEEPAPPNLATLGSCGEDEQLRLPAAAPPPPVSYACTHPSDGAEAINVAHAEDKKLQYTLRSNPKRSRRFLDPDYTLELAAPGSASGPCPVPSATTSPAPGSSSSPAPIKKGNSLFSEKARACTECGKQFPSWKALFGHMRCHPERQWRGIQPPTSISNLRERSTIADRTAAAAPPQHSVIKDADVDYTAAPSRPLATTSPPAPSFWDQSDAENTITAQAPGPLPHPGDCDAEESDTESIEAAYMNGRDQHHAPAVGLNVSSGRPGRRSKRSLQDVVSGGDGGHVFSESHTPPDEVMEERDMADCLVMLAFAAKSKTDDSDGDSALQKWRPHVRKSPLLSLAEARKSMEPNEKRSSYNGRVQKSIHFLHEGEGAYERNWEEDHDKSSWDRKSRFECSTCKKTFRSHQALGGHRASHKKVKGCFARTNAADDGTPAQTDVAAEMGSIALTLATIVEDPHQQSCQREEEGVVETIDQQIAGDQEEQGPSPAPAPPPEEISMGQFLQFSITCSETMEEDQNFESAIAAPEKQMHLKHQTSSCSSSSSILAAAAGTHMLHQHHHPLQHSQQPKIHQCSICNRIFSTGQALGGHKRCHWGGSSMPEAGKRCPLMRQDSDGGTCVMGIAMSDQRTSEFSKKGRQDSGSFASVEAWMNISLSSATMEKDLAHVLATEKDLAHVSPGLSNKGRQDSVASCDEVKGGHASAHSWLGGRVSCQEEENKVTMGGRRAPCQEQLADEGMSAQRGWLDATCSNPKLSGKNQLHIVEERVYNRQQGAITYDLELVKEGKRCECSRGLMESGEEGCNNINEQVPAVQLKMEEMLDLNLPAPAEEEERAAAGDSLPLAAASNWLSSKERVAESAGS